MTKNDDGLTRRDFLKGVSAAAVGGAVGLPAVAKNAHAAQSTSRVVLIRNENALMASAAEEVSWSSTIDGDVIQQMMDEALPALFGMDTPADCWNTMIKPDDTVGIKTNVWGRLPTPEPLIETIKRGVMGAGVPDERIGIGDRDVQEQENFQNCTALINSRPMRTHSWSGVGSLIKNYITFDYPPDYHDDACADLAKLWELPVVKDKTRLNILVMITPQFHNIGPHHFDPMYTWPYRGLILSTDVVAADAVGLQIIQAQRRKEFGEERPIQPTAHHIRLADTVHHLGNADMDRIDLVRLGWDGEELI